MVASKRKSKSSKPGKYPVPKEMGGRLARALVRSFREMGFELPLTSHILCACSGGADSTALALFMMRYGRRVGALSQISLLHVNHGWRGKESDADERFVRRLGARFNVPVLVHRLEEKPKVGESWEAHARQFRKAVFKLESARHQDAVILTAHTADDQAETRLWRLFTGAFETLGKGILSRHEVEVRPLLSIRREDLRRFLKEEHQRWREDASNQDPRFLRARMRKEIMPAIERIFPQAIPAINSVEFEK